MYIIYDKFFVRAKASRKRIDNAQTERASNERIDRISTHSDHIGADVGANAFGSDDTDSVGYLSAAEDDLNEQSNRDD